MSGVFGCRGKHRQIHSPRGSALLAVILVVLVAVVGAPTTAFAADGVPTAGDAAGAAAGDRAGDGAGDAKDGAGSTDTDGRKAGKKAGKEAKGGPSASASPSAKASAKPSTGPSTGPSAKPSASASAAASAGPAIEAVPSQPPRIQDFGPPSISSIDLPKIASGNPFPAFNLRGANLGGVIDVLANGVNIPRGNWEYQAPDILVTASPKPGGTDDVYTVTDGDTTTVGDESSTVHWLSPPVIDSLTPNTGPKQGGTSIVITGSGFTHVDGVLIGNQAPTGLTIDSDTQITASTAVDVPSVVDVTVSISDVNMGASTEPMVSATSANTKFTFTEGPNISGLAPTSGSVDGGEQVVISGTGFAGVTGAAGVTFDGTNAASYTVDNDTQITAVTPAHSDGMVSVVVTSPDGPSNLDVEYTYVANALPQMNAQPQDRTVDEGDNATFSASSQNGVPAPTIKWQTGDGNGGWSDIPGATSDPLTLNAVNGSDDGLQVRAVFTNSSGSIESNPATLTVYTAPVVTTDPQSQTKDSGELVTFTAAATGNPTPSVKWQSKAPAGSWTDIPGETNLSYAFTTSAADDGTQYRAVFSSTMVNVSPEVITDVATLTVTEAPAVTTHPQSQTKNSGEQVTFTAAATGSPTPTVKWQSKTGAGGWVDISGETGLSYTFTTAEVDDAVQYRAVFDNGIGSAAATNAATLTVHFGPVVTTDPVSQTKLSGTQVTFTAAATGNPAPAVKWQSKVGAGSWTDISGQTSTTYSFGAVDADNGTQYRAVFDNTVGSPVMTAAATLTVEFAPAVTTHPQSQTKNSGEQVTFTAAATGSPTPTVKWQSKTGPGSWTDISGQTGLSYTFTTAGTDDGKQYRAVFDNGIGVAADTNAAMLIVQTGPVVTTDPQSQTKDSGEQVTFTAAATGNPTPTVKWQSKTGAGSWTDIAGETGLSYTFTTADSDDGTQYRAVFDNTVGSPVMTAAATLTVEFAPSVTTHPLSQTKDAGELVTFTAAATGSPAPQVKWQSKTGAGSWVDIAGETSGTYSFTTADADDGVQYRAVFDNGIGSAAATNAATLTVHFGPVVTTDPQSQTKSSGQPVTFTAAATGNPTPQVKWQSKTGAGSWVDIALQTTTTLTFTTADADNGKQYRAVFDNEIGSPVMTAAATLTVEFAPAVTTHPLSQTKDAGELVTFTAAATGSPAPQVKWQSKTGAGSWVDIAGETSGTYSFTTADADDGVQYRAVFDNGIGSPATSNAATLTVHFGPVVTTDPQSQTKNSGVSVTFTAAATGSPAPQVKWQSKTGAGSWVDIALQTTTTLTFTTADADNGKQYRAVFDNEIGSPVMTAAATLTVEFAPSVTTHPQSQTKDAGELVTFTAAATGSPAPSVKWQSKTGAGSWVDIAGETSGTYSFTTAVNDNGKQYRAVFTNGIGSPVNTDPATLTVTLAPNVTTQPQNQTVVAAGIATFTTAATGLPTPTVKWQVKIGSGGWVDIAGQTTTTLTFTASSVDHDNQYRAVFDNGIGGAVNTDPATLTVNTSPAVEDQPQSQTKNAGSSVTFTATAAGRPTPTVQWQVKVGAGNWTNISGATSASYTFTTASGDDGKQYRAAFTNSVATEYSDGATLTVHTGPAVTTQPQNQTVVTGQSVSFTAAASGTPTPTVQWQQRISDGPWTDIVGETGATLTFTTALNLNGVKYRAVFTNSVGPVNSDAATLTVLVQPLPPNAPTGLAVVAGTSSISVSWLASTTNGTPVTGYVATASPGPSTCSPKPDELTCVLGAAAGTTYTVTVVANSAAGDSLPSDMSGEATPEVPQPPATPPATNLKLTTDQGEISSAEPGEQITFIGTGFAKYSTVVITIYSTPTVLGTAVTDGFGYFAKLITIPPGLEVGDHTAVAQGVAPDGSARAMALEITVAVDSGSGLAVTGPAVAMMVVIGLGLTTGGLALVGVTNRRRRRT